ncbi:MAG: preprotein translocase subunit SecY [Candidatus Diapherotrites archaeon]|nr:preprotein translocase subunit SecY [Candidatus Diapherotrites archaeon]
MSLVDLLYNIGRKLPEIRPPEVPPDFKTRLMWTLVVLVSFYILSLIPPYGLQAVRGLAPEAFQLILASNLGSILAAGIGPIVIASIVLQLLVGSGIIQIDMRSQEGRAKFMTIQKVLAIFFSFFEAWIYVSTGFLQAVPGLELIVALQVALGSIFLIYLDEIVLKWGIGSGISLFIAANVTRAAMWNGFGIHPESYLMGLINAISTASPIWWTYLIPYIITILVFLIVVYAEGIHVDIPIALSYGRGAGGRYPIKLLYLNVIPVIFAVALFANIQLLAYILKDTPISVILGQYREVPTETGVTYELVGGLAYYLQPPYKLMDDIILLLTTGQVPSTLVPNLIHAIIYILLLTLTSVLFGMLWIELAGFGPKQIAEQLASSGFGIPGFRRDPRVLEKVLEKYIPTIAILGSAFVGFLAGFTDVFRGLASGMGILLAVEIIYRYYEIIMREKVLEMYPALKKVLE